MAKPDYYNVLGVSRNADAADLKRAYREQVMRWHPDRNQDDPVAAQRFKLVAEAYKVLNNPEERARYDRLGPLYHRDGAPPTPEDLQEVLSQFMGGLFGRKRNAIGGDLKYTLSISLEDVAHGGERTISIPRRVQCHDCLGLGATETGRQVCPHCKGSGRSSGRLLRTTCVHCDGRGYRITTPCPTCHGKGTHRVTEDISVKVPRGIATGQKLKLSGKGDCDPISGRPGDLYVVVHVQEHELFQRRGDHLLVKVPITVGEAALGADLTVPTLGGTTTIRIPPGTPHGKVFRIPGQGLPKVKRSQRGDLHLEVELEVPDNLSPSEHHALAAWAESLPGGRHPRREAFRRAVQERS